MEDDYAIRLQLSSVGVKARQGCNSEIQKRRRGHGENNKPVTPHDTHTANRVRDCGEAMKAKS